MSRTSDEEMEHTIAEQIEELERRITTSEEEVATIRRQLEEAEEAESEETGNQELAEQVNIQKERLRLAKALNTTLKDVHRRMRDVSTSLEQHSRHTMRESTPADPADATRSGKLNVKPPKPYEMGQDFDFFAELFLAYVEGQPFELQKRILKTLLSAECYHAGRSAINKGTSIKNILEELQGILSPELNLAARINRFMSCKQRKGESFQSFSSRIRHQGELCYKEEVDSRYLESSLVQQFIQGSFMTTHAKNILRAKEFDSLTDVVRLATELHGHGTEEPLEALSTEANWSDTKPDEEPLTSTPVKKCFSCGSTDHLKANCDQKWKRCYQCNSTTHLIKDCPQKRSFQGFPRRPTPRCQICRREGHEAVDCRGAKITIRNHVPAYSGYRSTYQQKGQTNQPRTFKQPLDRRIPPVPLYNKINQRD